MQLDWRQDGSRHWVARVDHNRDARISATEAGSFQARMAGGDPGGNVIGTYPTLDIAKLAFEPPDGRARAERASADHEVEKVAAAKERDAQELREQAERDRLAKEQAEREQAAKEEAARQAAAAATAPPAADPAPLVPPASTST